MSIRAINISNLHYSNVMELKKITFFFLLKSICELHFVDGSFANKENCINAENENELNESELVFRMILQKAFGNKNASSSGLII